MPLKFARYNEVSLYRGFFSYRKFSIKPHRGLICFGAGRGGGGLGFRLNRDGRLNVFNLETTMVSVLYKELEYKVKKLKNKTF